MARRLKKQEPEPAATHESPLISNQKLRRLYATMLQCRTLQERLRILTRQRKIAGDYDIAIGQEAAFVGTASDLRPEDALSHSRHDLVAAFVKGAPPAAIFAHLMAGAGALGRDRSSPAGFGDASLNIIAPVSTSAAQINIATGVALAFKMRKCDNLVVAYCGNDSASPDLLHETLQFAGAHDLPILFVCQTRPGAEFANEETPAKTRDLSLQAHSCGFPGITVDGNDVVAVYRVAQEAIARARRGHGPTLIDCQVSLLPSPAKANPGKPRNPSPNTEELKRWKARDPVAGMEKYLARKGLFTPASKEEILDSFHNELETAVSAARKPRRLKAREHF